MPLILSRLPREISLEWKRQNPNRQKDMYELLSFLKTELRSRKVSTFPWRERKSVPPFPSNRKTVPRGQYTTATLQATVRKACFICEEDHAIENCPKFIRMNPKERITKVKRLGLCFLCLKRGHLGTSCKAKLKCRIEECSKRHHPLIHLKQDRRSVSENQPNTPEDNKVHVTHTMVGNRGTLLQSARARLYNEEGNSMIVNCLFDSGSQRSFVKKSVAEALSLKGPYETVNIESFGNSSNECIRVRRVKFWLTSVKDNSHKEQMVEASCLKKITDRPNVRLDIKQYSHFTSLQLAALPGPNIIALPQISCRTANAPRISRFRRVCFGLTCSPFLAMSVTRYHALKHLQGFPLGANQVLQNMCVDYIVFSVDENEEAIETVRQLMVLMKKGGFYLTKWVSNMKAVLADLLTEDIMGKNTMTSKTLGIVWDSENDELAYSVLSEVDPWSRDTKRQLISVTAKLYDPLGHLSPYIIRAKILFQKLWQKGLNWDDELPSDLQKEWQTWKLELCDISDIRIPRCLIPFHGSTINKVELHTSVRHRKLPMEQWSI
ncbi:hypothetical protein T07_4244 [Trichinella nelsoni]|uniref:DUF1758 domain-containing protein n=1 Tax=Trichinella nelsoni TaxID=6336 RepID=A0A0V0RHM7_9BILA|nr:hypothetical protein T07_4244 [Trichinella nelsoni]